MSVNTAFDCMAGVGTAVLVLVGIAATSPAPSTPEEEPRTIEIVAKRFAFEPARIEVDEGETVRLMIRSADGVHGFGIRKFKLSELVPRGGEPIVIEFTATAVGEFEILCSEYCGAGHDSMKGRLVVRAREGGRE